MFNRKLKERINEIEMVAAHIKNLESIVDRISKLERTVEGFQPPTPLARLLVGETSWSCPGLRAKVDAISAKLGLEYEKTPDTKGAWIAVDKRKRKARKG